jgi:uncharacterized protein YerC
MIKFHHFRHIYAFGSLEEKKNRMRISHQVDDQPYCCDDEAFIMITVATLSFRKRCIEYQSHTSDIYISTRNKYFL